MELVEEVGMPDEGQEVWALTDRETADLVTELQRSTPLGKLSHQEGEAIFNRMVEMRYYIVTPTAERVGV